MHTGDDKPLAGSSGFRFLVTIAAFVIVVAGLRAAEPILVPILLSAFVAVLCAAPMKWMQAKGVPGLLAVFIVFLVLAIVATAGALFLGKWIHVFSSELPKYQTRLEALEQDVRSRLAQLDLDGDSPSLETNGGDDVPPAEGNSRLLDYLDPNAATRMLQRMVVSLSGLLSNLLLILLTVMFILLEASSIPRKLAALPGDSKRSVESYDRIVIEIKRYMAIKTAVSLLTGVLIAIYLQILGIDFAPLWGLLAFLLNFIPNIGSFLAAAPAIVVALLQPDKGAGPAIAAAVGFLVVNVTIGNIIEPRLMGRRLELSTLVVFLSLVFWGWVLGPIGMLLSVPLTIALKIVLANRDETRWLAVLLGPGDE